MTEDEASKKWCPFARYVLARTFTFGQITVAVNRWLDGEDTELNPYPCRCIASDCAAWRWRELWDKDAAKPLWSTTDGYCGLAGKP